MNQDFEKKAAIYVRSFGNNTVASVGRQLQTCRDYVAASGKTVGGEYVDATDGRPYRTKPALEKLLHDARTGAYDMVVVEDIDRISRDLLQIVEFERELGIPIHALRGIPHLETWIAEAERKRKRAAELVAAGRRTAKARRPAGADEMAVLSMEKTR